MTIAEMEYKAIGLLRSIKSKMAPRGKTTSVGVFVNEEYEATFFLLANNVWRLNSPQNNYTRANPSLDYLLRKYAKLMDPQFRREVGPEAVHDDDEASISYEERVGRYVTRYRDRLLKGLIKQLEFVLKQVSR